MNPKRVVEPIFNPALELLPLILFMVAGYYLPLNMAFLVGTLSYVICLLITLILFRFSPPYMLIVTGFILILFALTSIIPPFNQIDLEYSTIMCEVLLVVIFSILIILRSYITTKIKIKQSKIKRASVVARLHEFFHVSRIVRDVLIFHLLVVLIYNFLPQPYHTLRADRIIFPGLLFALVMVVVIYETIRLGLFRKKIRMEDWLPIVNETGGVIGKVAFSVSQTSKKSFLHPSVRIALIHKGMLYLNDRPGNYVIDPYKIDYPFEKFVFYNQSLDDAIRNALEKGSGMNDLPVRFVFRYLFKNKTSDRLIYLYTCRINDEELMNKLNLSNGKLWTEKQIEENLGKGIFCECFEKEYEILKNTVLMAEKMVFDQEQEIAGH